MRISIDSRVNAQYGNLRFVYILGHNVNIISTPPREKKLARSVEADLRARFADREFSEDPNVAGWVSLAHAMGIEAPADLPAPIGLAEEVLSGKNIPKINNVVDAANITALRFLCPVGAFDLNKLSGSVVLRLASTAEKFRPMFSDEIEMPSGEVVYADEEMIFSRYSRDAHETRITENTVNILCVIDALPEAEEGELLARREFLLDLLKDVCGNEATFVEGIPVHTN